MKNLNYITLVRFKSSHSALKEFQNLFQLSINNFKSPRNAVKLIGKTLDLFKHGKTGSGIPELENRVKKPSCGL